MGIVATSSTSSSAHTPYIDCPTPLINPFQTTAGSNSSSNMVRDVCSLTSFIVSVLLAYRVGRVYDRWWTACNAFGSTGSGCVGLLRQAYTNIEDPSLQVGARGASGLV